MKKSLVDRINDLWMSMQQAAGEEPFHLPFGELISDRGLTARDQVYVDKVVAQCGDLDRVDDVSNVDLDELYEELEAEGLVILHEDHWVTIRVFGPLRENGFGPEFRPLKENEQ